MRISDWRSDVCSSDLASRPQWAYHQPPERLAHTIDAPMARQARYAQKTLTFRPGAGAAPRGDRPIGLFPHRGAAGNKITEGVTGDILRRRTSPPKIGREPCRERVCQIG